MDIATTSTSDRTGQKRTKINKNVIMLLLSLVVGGVGVYLAKGFIEQKINYYKGQLENKEEMVSVVVPNRNISRGTVVSMRDFVVRKIPKKYAHSHTIVESTFPSVVGRRIGFDISKGRALLWAHLDGGVTPTFSSRLEKGKRALSFSVDKISSISGFLQPGDKVDLLLEYQEKIYPLIQSLSVLATGSKTSIDKTGKKIGDSFRIITVDVTPEVAEKITLAKSIGKITAILRAPQDDKEISEQPMTVARLFNRPPPRKHAKKTIRVKNKPGIEFIIGGGRG
ncbi:MAG: Flp pilus assembly protein CpaB [Candidatus Thiodiazotropha sp.]|jgi:pilus assembly protein CpaB